MWLLDAILVQKAAQPNGQTSLRPFLDTKRRIIRSCCKSLKRELLFLTSDGSAMVMMTFGAICACVDFEDSHPSISTTVLAIHLRCAENNNVWLKTTNTVAEPSAVENKNSVVYSSGAILCLNGLWCTSLYSIPMLF